jgi:hypothetical protein
LYKALEAYKKLNDEKDFAFMHCFNKLEECKKRDQVWLTLNEVGCNEGSMAPTATSADHPAADVKKAKAAKQAGSLATSWIDASSTLMVESLSTNSKESHERSYVRWKSMVETQQENLKLER